MSAADPRGWPVAPSRVTRRARLTSALRAHSAQTREARESISIPGLDYATEWLDAPWPAKVIMALPVLAILAAVTIPIIWVASVGLDAAYWELTKAGMFLLAVVALYALHRWLRVRDGGL